MPPCWQVALVLAPLTPGGVWLAVEKMVRGLIGSTVVPLAPQRPASAEQVTSDSPSFRKPVAHTHR